MDVPPGRTLRRVRLRRTEAGRREQRISSQNRRASIVRTLGIPTARRLTGSLAGIRAWRAVIVRGSGTGLCLQTRPSSAPPTPSSTIIGPVFTANVPAYARFEFVTQVGAV